MNASFHFSCRLLFFLQKKYFITFNKPTLHIHLGFGWKKAQFNEFFPLPRRIGIDNQAFSYIQVLERFRFDYLYLYHWGNMNKSDASSLFG